MIAALRRADAILRGRPPAGSWRLALGCGLAYGAIMGTFGGRPTQVAYSALKVPLLLMATLLLGLPTYLILNTLLGVRSDFAAAWRAVVASQAGFTIILVSLAPLTLLFYASTTFYQGAVFFNALIFALSSLGAQWILARSYRPLIERNPNHRFLLRTWLILYAFVGIQMGWNLRPFVGDPAKPSQFFRPGPWENAYVIVARMLWETIAG